MKRSVRNVTLIIFVCVVVGCGFAVLYFGTSTGLTFGGAASRIQTQSKSYPVYGQVGWFRNTAPWPITIESITTNVRNATAPPIVYFETSQSSPTKQSSKLPLWALNSSKPPYQLNGGSLRYLGFSFVPKDGTVAAMTSITVTFSGPLGLTFHQTFGGTRVATASSSLPGGLLGGDPSSNPSSLDAYVVALRSALAQPDLKTVSAVMGNNATSAEAQAFITSQKGYLAADSVMAVAVTKDSHEQRVTFYKGDPVKGALPSIEVVWSHYRWAIIPPGG
jgi:hypothetical protein